MPDYSSCLLQGYGVLAGAPTRVKAPLVSSRFAIVEWTPPKLLPETVTSYNVHIRRMDTDEFMVLEKDHPPIIIEDLDSNSYYEAYIVAMNAHGRGPPSSRLVFKTKLHVSLKRHTFHTKLLLLVHMCNSFLIRSSLVIRM